MKKIGFVLLVASLMSFTADLNQLIKTKINISVLDQTGNAVGGAEVRIYASKTDYQQKKNEVTLPKFTNKKGKALFVGLEKKKYFIRVEKGDMDNSDSGVITEELVPHRINKFSTIVSDF